jgi:hypothetical protein
MAAPSRLEHQREGRVAGEVYALEGVHLDRYVDHVSSSSSAREAARRQKREELTRFEAPRKRHGGGWPGSSR